MSRRKVYYSELMDSKLDPIVSRNIKRAVSESGYLQKEFIAKAGISKATLNNYFRGTQVPSVNAMNAIAAVAKKDLAWFYFDHDQKSDNWEKAKNYEQNITEHDTALNNQNFKSAQWIPLLGKVPAGFPELSELDIQKMIPVTLGDVPKNTFALEVKGDSMIPEFCEGEIIFFCTDFLNPKLGKFIVAMDEFGGTMIKQYQEKNQETWLVSLNPIYKPFKANEHYRILGTVVGKSSNFKKY